MSGHTFIISVQVSEAAGTLHLESEFAVALLAGSATGVICEDDWNVQSGRIEGAAETDFLKVFGFPNMMAFRPELSAESNLELYLESGEFLPVTTPAGDFILWHHLAGASLNVLDKKSFASDGGMLKFHFIPHRLPGSCALFTTPECRHTHLFLQVHPSELPSNVGGTPDNDTPPDDLRPENWRSLIQEAIWRGWTGLDFKIVWQHA